MSLLPPTAAACRRCKAYSMTHHSKSALWDLTQQLVACCCNPTSQQIANCRVSQAVGRNVTSELLHAVRCVGIRVATCAVLSKGLSACVARNCLLKCDVANLASIHMNHYGKQALEASQGVMHALHVQRWAGYMEACMNCCC